MSKVYNCSYRLLLFKTLLISLFVSNSLFAQSVNDYRTTGDGNWTDNTIWEVYNGTAWVAASEYPGESAGANDVFILGNDAVTLDTDIANSFNSLTIGPGDLLIDDDSSLNTMLITLETGGTIEWIPNGGADLAIPANAVLIINGGILVEDNPCNANKTLTIGTSVYASCNGGGGGVDNDFNDINTGGGTINVDPSSNSPVCIGDTLTLFANPSGAESGNASTTFSWSGTGPGGYTFSSTSEDPTINTTGFTAGTYTYTVTITDPNSNSNTDSVDVTIATPPNAPISGGNETICSGDTIPALTASVGAGETVDWYNVASGGTALITDTTSYTPLTGGSYFAEARNTTTGCVSSTRTEIILTISSCAPTTVITNRRITYRVNN